MDEGPRRVELTPERYDERWAALAAAGHGIHGEAELVIHLLHAEGVTRPAGELPTVLDAGCGTGRVAIELARRGCAPVGIDVDPTLLARARDKAPALPWVEADLATLALDVAPGPFDAIVLAGNVMVFVARGTEAAVLSNLAERCAPGGLVVAGFQLVAGRVSVGEYDEHARAAGLAPVTRWSSWDRAEFDDSAAYVVAVHRKSPRGHPR